MIDEATGKLRPIASVLDSMERVFGEVLDDSEAARIKQAFGRDQAVRVFEAMWAGGKELRAAARELEAATMADVRRRARARDDNLGGALDRIRRRRTELAERLAAALEPALRRLEPHLDRAIRLAGDRLGALAGHDRGNHDAGRSHRAARPRRRRTWWPSSTC